MKVCCNKDILQYNPKHTYELIQRQILSSLNHRQPVELRSFSGIIHDVGETFQSQNQKGIMTSLSYKFAQTLADFGEYNLSQIIYGFLIKFNEDNLDLMELFATKALKLAKKKKDFVHMMARTYDLSQIYRKREYGSTKHLFALYDTKKNLNHIINNYDESKNKYNTISRKMKPKNAYEFMLCSIRMEIAKIVKSKYPIQAKYELNKARQLISKYGDGTMSSRIAGLIYNINKNTDKKLS